MPPKKSKGASATAEKNGAGSSDSRKRKQAPDDASGPTKKARSTSSKPNNTTASQEQLLQFLLSSSALSLCQPPARYTNNKTVESKAKLYTPSAAQLSPFAELLCTAVLSRPISHRLGQRAISVLLNPPYAFLSAKSLKDAGTDRIWDALNEAKTQHKQKTAEQLSNLADTILEQYSDGDANGESLEALRKKCDINVEEEREALKKFKGFGKTAADIFFRRIQWAWDEAFPVIDRVTASGLKELGLPADAKRLNDFIDENWKSIQDSDAIKEMDGDVEKKKRKAFVVVLERAVGCNLEKNGEDFKKQAANS